MAMFSKAGTINQIIDELIDIIHDIGYRFATIITLSIQTPQLLTIVYLKFEQVQFTTQCYV